MNDPDRALAKIAARQYGAFSREQASQVGVTKSMMQRRLEGQRWIRLRRSVYCLAGSHRNWRQRLVAAWLAAGKGAVVSHESAAVILGLPGFREGPIELTVVGQARTRPRGITLHTTDRLEQVDITLVRGIRVTCPARTLIDLAAVEKIEKVEIAMDYLLARGQLSLSHLTSRLDALACSGRRGTAKLRQLVAERTRFGVPQTEFETRTLQWFKAEGLRLPVSQFPVKDRNGDVVATVDFAWPDVRLAVECDGFGFHSLPEDLERDLNRRNAITDANWKAIHITWRISSKCL